jgi:hypothetical protein
MLQQDGDPGAGSNGPALGGPDEMPTRRGHRTPKRGLREVSHLPPNVRS